MDMAPREDTSLLRRGTRKSSVIEIKQEFSRKNECNRRVSSELMGVGCPYDSSDELNLRKQMWDDKKDWEDVRRLSTMEEWGSEELN